MPTHPFSIEKITQETEKLGFDAGSMWQTGLFLQALAASKPGGTLLELGTGTGIGAAWLLAGMDKQAHLTTIDIDPEAQDVARRHLGNDPRTTFILEDGEKAVAGFSANSFDLIFADAWPGKFSMLDETLALLRPGGLYFIDDLLPQPNWPEGHGDMVKTLVPYLESLADFASVYFEVASGLMICTRQS